MSASASSGECVALLDFERDLVGAAVLGSFERADGAGDARIEIGAGAGDDARREGGSVEFVLRIENERNLHRAGPLGAGRARRAADEENAQQWISLSASTAMRLPLRAKWCQ